MAMSAGQSLVEVKRQMLAVRIVNDRQQLVPLARALITAGGRAVGYQDLTKEISDMDELRQLGRQYLLGQQEIQQNQPSLNVANQLLQYIKASDLLDLYQVIIPYVMFVNVSSALDVDNPFDVGGRGDQPEPAPYWNMKQTRYQGDGHTKVALLAQGGLPVLVDIRQFYVEDFSYPMVPRSANQALYRDLYYGAIRRARRVPGEPLTFMPLSLVRRMQSVFERPDHPLATGVLPTLFRETPQDARRAFSASLRSRIGSCFILNNFAEINLRPFAPSQLLSNSAAMATGAGSNVLQQTFRTRLQSLTLLVLIRGDLGDVQPQVIIEVEALLKREIERAISVAKQVNNNAVMQQYFATCQSIANLSQYAGAQGVPAYVQKLNVLYSLLFLIENAKTMQGATATDAYEETARQCNGFTTHMMDKMFSLKAVASQGAPQPRISLAQFASRLAPQQGGVSTHVMVFASIAAAASKLVEAALLHTKFNLDHFRAVSDRRGVVFYYHGQQQDALQTTAFGDQNRALQFAQLDDMEHAFVLENALGITRYRYNRVVPRGRYLTAGLLLGMQVRASVDVMSDGAAAFDGTPYDNLWHAALAIFEYALRVFQAPSNEVQFSESSPLFMMRSLFTNDTDVQPYDQAVAAVAERAVTMTNQMMDLSQLAEAPVGSTVQNLNMLRMYVIPLYTFMRAMLQVPPGGRLVDTVENNVLPGNAQVRLSGETDTLTMLDKQASLASVLDGIMQQRQQDAAQLMVPMEKFRDNMRNAFGAACYSHFQMGMRDLVAGGAGGYFRTRGTMSPQRRAGLEPAQQSGMRAVHHMVECAKQIVPYQDNPAQDDEQVSKMLWHANLPDFRATAAEALLREMAYNTV
jgi:hypothetical protein